MTVETKLSARALEGQQWRVKQTPITRKYGVRTYGAWQNKNDDRAWPGEVGTVRKFTWTAHNGEAMSCLKLCFDRGREVSIDTANLADFVLHAKATMLDSAREGT